jgi:mannose-1-phosphate guanylyltransferase
MNNAVLFERTTGVILSGTHAWTNSAFDALMPRVLLPVAHRPLISYAIDWFHGAGIRNAAVCGNRQTRALRMLLASHAPAPLKITYHEDPMPRGAAGCLRDAAAVSDADTFVVVDGTTIPNVDLGELRRRHQLCGAAATVVVATYPRPHGNPGLQTPTGIYVFNRSALSQIPERGFCDIKETLIPQLYRAGHRVVTHQATGAIPHVFGASTYLAVNEWMVEQLVAGAEAPEGFIRVGTALVHRDAFVADDAVFIGPVLVGSGARIGARAVMVGPTSIGRDVRVEQGGLVSRSAIWRRSTIGAHAQVDRSILSDDTVVAPNEHAFRSVRIGAERSVAVLAGAASRPAGNGGVNVLDLPKVLGRGLLGANWSRTPAAQ